MPKRSSSNAAEGGGGTAMQKTTLVYVVVKQTLNYALKIPFRERDAFRNAISRLVDANSKLTNMGSLVMNAWAMHICPDSTISDDMLHDMLKKPTIFRQALMMNYESARRNSTTYIGNIDAVWQNLFVSLIFPSTPSTPGLSQTIDNSLINFYTNMMNHLITDISFDRIQKRYIMDFLSCYMSKKEARKCFWPVRAAINNQKSNLTEEISNDALGVEVASEIAQFILAERNSFGIQEKPLDERWRKKNLGKVLRFYYRVLKGLAENERHFNLFPIMTCKSHYTTIDDETLRCLFFEVKKQGRKLSKQENVRLREECNALMLQDVFNYKKLKTAKSGFRPGKSVLTDGFAISMRFEKEVENGSIVSQVCEPSRKKAKKDKIHDTDDYHRVIAIDPGRVNMICAVEKVGDGLRENNLTRKAYYANSGITYHRKRVERWRKQISEQEDVMSQVSSKTVSLKNFRDFLAVYSKVYHSLWNHYSQRKYARWRFRLYCLKNKTLDRFFSDLCRDGDGKCRKSDVLIAYGAAKFQSNAKGETSVPTSNLYKRCTIHYKTTLVDEFNTSQICYACNHRVTKVIEKTKGELRGLKYCRNNDCPHNNKRDALKPVYLKRDLNAALNILTCATASARPLCFTSMFTAPKLDPIIFVEVTATPSQRKEFLPPTYP